MGWNRMHSVLCCGVVLCLEANSGFTACLHPPVFVGLHGIQRPFLYQWMSVSTTSWRDLERPPGCKLGLLVAIFFFFFILICLFLVLHCPLRETHIHNNPKSSALHSYQCVQYFRVSKQRYGCQCLGFNVCTDVDACDCTRGLYGHRKVVCNKSWLWERNPLPPLGLEPASVLRLDFQTGALPTGALLDLAA